MKNMSEDEKQIYYRDARYKGYYGDIWTSVGKCVFCDLRDKYIVFEENGVVLAISLYAYIDGQLMVITRRHVETLAELTQDEWQTTRKLMHLGRKIIKKVHGISGINYVQRYGGAIANNTVPHHFHVVIVPFDDPKLATWDYRKLDYTPLENAGLYKKERKFIAKNSLKFDRKYSQGTLATIGVQAILRDKKTKRILLSTQGGLPLLEDLRTGHSLKTQLFEYLNSEIGLPLPTDKNVRLVSSVLRESREVLAEPHLKMKYPLITSRLINTYEYSYSIDKAELQLGQRYIWKEIPDSGLQALIKDGSNE